MDELFALEQRQPGKPAAGEQQQPAKAAAPGAQPAGGHAEARSVPAAAAAAAAPTADELMDELNLLEQQQRQQQQQQPVQQQGPERKHKPGAKRQRKDNAVAPAPAHGPPAAASRQQEAQQQHQLASAGTSRGSLPPTQPAAGGEAAAGALPAAAQPAPPTTVPLASCFVPHKRVVAFVWAVVRCIVPAALLGDPRNRRQLRDAIRQAGLGLHCLSTRGCDMRCEGENLRMQYSVSVTADPLFPACVFCPCSRYVRLRRYEQMSVHQAMQGMRLSGLPWLQPQAQPRRPGRPAQQAAGGVPASADQPAGQQQAAAARPEAGEGGVQAAAQERRQRTCPTQHAAQQRTLALWLGWLFAGTLLGGPLVLVLLAVQVCKRCETPACCCAVLPVQ